MRTYNIVELPTPGGSKAFPSTYEIDADWMWIIDGVAKFYVDGFGRPLHSAPADKVIITSHKKEDK